MARWTCQRVSGGQKCGFTNEATKRICFGCGKHRAKKRKPAHTKALELSYESYIELNGGEWCGICGREPTPMRRLDRDHCHDTGAPRGLLCARCNRALPRWMTATWLRDAAEYVERAPGGSGT